MKIRSESRQGRPAVYSTEDRQYLADLISQYGIRGARRLAKIRVGQGTMVKIAREHGIALQRGRRPRPAA